MDKITLSKFTDTKNSYELMHKWCSESFVYEWFEQRILSITEITKKYQNKLLTKEQSLYFINYNNTPIGYLQIYKYNGIVYNELIKYNNIYEYDIFIGEKEYLSKGIGSKIIEIIDKFIYQNYHADCIVLRPFKRNIRAIKCYENNNYKIIKEYIDTDTIGKEETITILMKPKKNKKVIYSLLIIISLFIITGCQIKIEENPNQEEISEVISSMRIIINEKEYTIHLEDNETVKSFINLLPQELEMQELNGNEKYVYLDTIIPSNSVLPKHINNGDVMLYGNNCLVIFYKSFDTTYRYTKIGHIDDLPDLGNGNIKVTIRK